jgi:hypothetical protein
MTQAVRGVLRAPQKKGRMKNKGKKRLARQEGKTG